ncbi:MAG: hypothetical protein J2P47_12955 [Acetobacteraceae bacterium]|nr:hypothetical protein [Acetobacteraceae bacterium]
MLAAAGLLALAVAGCGPGETASGGTGGKLGSLLNDWPAGRNFTGQGEMGVGVMGNSSGAGGPSQVAVPNYGHGRGETQ